jgi:vacuolar-type H+-ATPase subunit I/STV1
MKCSKVVEMQLFVEKERSIYVQLNTLKLSKNVFIGRIWCPKVYEEDLMSGSVQLSLIYPGKGSLEIKEIDPRVDDTPPTLFKLNAFTAPF